MLVWSEKRVALEKYGSGSISVAKVVIGAWTRTRTRRRMKREDNVMVVTMIDPSLDRCTSYGKLKFGKLLGKPRNDQPIDN